MGLLDPCQFSYHHCTQPRALGLLPMDTPVAALSCSSVSTILRTRNTLLGLFLSYSLVIPSFAISCSPTVSTREAGEMKAAWCQWGGLSSPEEPAPTPWSENGLCIVDTGFAFSLHSLGVPESQQLSWTRVVRTGLPFVSLHSIQPSALSGSRLGRVWPGLAPGPQSLPLCWALHSKV